MSEFDVRPNDPSLPYGALSGGNQQKALLAKWFQTEPRLLLLDEPTQGVDVGARQQIFGLIRAAAEERGMVVVCASSDYEQLATICDRVVVFGRGRVFRRARRRGADEGADRRAVLRRDGRRGGRGRRVNDDRGDRGGRRPQPSRASGGVRGSRTRSSATRCCSSGPRRVVVFGILRPDTFLTTSNFTTIFGSQAILVVLTLALLAPLTAGDYDLSVAATMTLAAMVLAILNVNHGWSIWASILAALGVGVAVGLVNGALVVVLDIDSLIATLGSSTFIAGIVLWISDSQTISGISEGLIDWVVVKRLFGIPLEFYYGIALGLVLFYVFEYMPVGRRLLFVGRGRSVARLSGIRVSHLRWGALVASGLISAFAGILYAGTLGSADPTSGLSFLLPAFAAAFLGATTIFPGRFNPIGSIAAVYFLVTGITGLQLLGVQTFVQQLFYGGALILAVALSQAARRRDARQID